MNLNLKRNMSSFILALSIILLSFNTTYAVSSTALDMRTINFSGNSRNVSYVTIDLNDSEISVESVSANNQISTSDSLEKIANQVKSEDKEVLAAINGTFFSAYNNNPLPWGTIQKNGQVIHIGNTGSVIGFTDTNEVKLENLYISITGSINEYGTWYAWNINHPMDNPNAITIFTPEFGEETHEHSFNSIVIKEGKVNNITSGKAPIPSDGYVIVTGIESFKDKFEVGDAVDYEFNFSEIEYKNGNSISGKDLSSVWKDVTTAVGAGPTLIKDGIITADGKSEGFFEDKILTNRAQRSFIGVTKENKLIIGVVSSVSIKELAEIAKELELYQAMNLDGGASSGLIYKDKIVHKPGRLLSNAIVITKQINQPPN